MQDGQPCGAAFFLGLRHPVLPVSSHIPLIPGNHLRRISFRINSQRCRHVGLLSSGHSAEDSHITHGAGPVEGVSGRGRSSGLPVRALYFSESAAFFGFQKKKIAAKSARS